ncbi:hypothetical protein D9619_006169 [Psilocybe cf. subviscida]|uniref:RhoGAP-domain-containing protein n=1 Tax=Psilocybe cf. subviscida TaxID=2480587 RepID=A0A8H5B4K5_9AGAR|nr:hypothetical protein D9619_006169 [Psilocybe cf. subviscida]
MAYSSYSNGLNVQATPTRDRDRHPFPQSAHPSPGPSLRQTSSSSASNSATHLPSTAGSAATPPNVSTHAVLTAEHFLKQHSSSSNPTLAALEQAVADRNVLSGQNTQLWKLIEKQRAGYNQILKELERIRGERDTYKSRLAALNVLPSSTDKRQKSSSSSNAGASMGERGSRPSLDTVSSQMSSTSSGLSQSQQRQPLPRQHSDGTPSTSTSRNGTHQLHSSRSFDPINVNANTNHGSGSNSDSGMLATPVRSNSPSSVNAPSSRQNRVPPAPLVVPNHEDGHAAYTISHSPESAISTRQPGGGFGGSGSGGGSGVGGYNSSNMRPPDSPSTATPKPQSHSQAAVQAASYPRKASLADSISSVVTGSSSLSFSSGSSHHYGTQPNTPQQQQPQNIYASPPPPSAPPVLENPFGRGSASAGGNGMNARGLGPALSSPAIIQASSLGGTTISGSTPSPLAQPPYLPQQQSQAQQQTLLDARSPPHLLSRDSRISLPDEASRYIQNMSDSPAASPRTDVFPAPRSKLSNTMFPPPPAARESEFLDMDDDGDEEGDGDSNHAERSEDGSEDEMEGEADTTAGADHPGFDASTTSATRGAENNNNPFHNTDSEGYSYAHPHAEYMSNNNTHSAPSNSSREDIIGGYGSGSGYSGGSQRKDNKSASSSRVGIDEFPLPPPSNPYHQRPPGESGHNTNNGAAPSQQGYQPSGLSRAQAPGGAKQGQAGTTADQSSYHHNSNTTQHAAEALHPHLLPTSMQDAGSGPVAVASPYLTAPAMQQPSVSSSSSISSSGHQQPQSQSQQQPQKPAVNPASFRALPLISTDLPHTTITVSHSFVRPNDRGKEVLSFIVFVNPGSGKEGWKVEKMYSDVLSLDQRVRSSVARAVVKKIVTLPEGRLWKDHAPAKVDQRKAVLEDYLQSLIQLPVKNNDEVIAFFTTDIVRDQKQAVMKAGEKEGYLTKKGKNFGGWKTRFFVLQGPVLEYYDCRGGAHLGSIMITGAQIARQHRTERPPNADDETEYRHAFLIVEAKKGPGGNHPRHVLCAESDDDRDSWVEMLVRYYTGTYSEDLIFNPASGLTSVQSPAQPRASTSSNDVARSNKPIMTRGDTKSSSISLAASDDYLRSSSPSRSVDPSPIDRQGPSAAGGLDIPKRAIDRSNLGLPSSLPDSSPLSAATNFMQDVGTAGQRANSEQGHYPDLLQQQSSQDGRRMGGSRQHSPEQHRQRSGDDGRKPFHSSLTTVSPSPTAPSASQPDRVPSPEKPESKVKISGPMNGTPIPSGFKFGGKDTPSVDPAQAASDRREKAKSRSFWGFGKASGDKQSHAAFPPRAVFGVPLEDALEVAQICNLPAIVFRSIQYLEAKKADQEEGIYRLSGSSAVIKGLKDMFNNEGDIDLLASDEYWDPHAIAGLLKSFLRELPSSILTRELHLKFLAVIDIPDAQERIRELSHLIAALPLANYSLLRALTAHLILIVQNAPVNKMTMRNVGIVFSPTLGIPAGVFSLMLGEFNRVFNVDGVEAADAGEEEADSGLLDHPVSELKRNSRQYTDAAADQMLGLSGRTLKKGATADEAHSDVGDNVSVTDHDESGTDAMTITTEGGDAPGTVESSATSASPSSAQEPQHTDGAYEYEGHDYDSSGITVVLPAGESADTTSTSSTQATPMKSPSKASAAAANRGLNVTVTMSERGNRHSRMIGLPASPRPNGTSMSGMAQAAAGGTSGGGGGDAHES